MPINANGQLITAISCEGREIVRAHAGLDLVWAKADPTPPGFVDVGGIYWSTMYLTWTDGGSGIQLSTPFAGETVGYYTYAAINRYLSANPNYRLPSDADVVSLYNFLRANSFAGLNAACSQSTTHWLQVNAQMRNAYGLAFKGCGRWYSGNLQFLRSYDYLMLAQQSPTLMRYQRTNYNITDPAFNDLLISSNFYLPVRLIYTP